MEYKFMSSVELLIAGEYDWHKRYNTQEEIAIIGNQFKRMFGNVKIFQEINEGAAQPEIPLVITIYVQSDCGRKDLLEHLPSAFDIYYQLKEKMPYMYIYIHAPMEVTPFTQS